MRLPAPILTMWPPSFSVYSIHTICTCGIALSNTLNSYHSRPSDHFSSVQSINKFYQCNIQNVPLLDIITLPWFTVEI